MTGERRVYTDDELRMAIVAMESKEMGVVDATKKYVPSKAEINKQRARLKKSMPDGEMPTGETLKRHVAGLQFAAPGPKPYFTEFLPSQCSIDDQPGDNGINAKLKVNYGDANHLQVLVRRAIAEAPAQGPAPAAVPELPTSPRPPLLDTTNADAQRSASGRKSRRRTRQSGN